MIIKYFEEMKTPILDHYVKSCCCCQRKISCKRLLVDLDAGKITKIYFLRKHVNFGELFLAPKYYFH